MSAFRDITGKKFNYLTAIKPLDKRDGSSFWWLWQCDCGNRLELKGILVTRKIKPQKSCKDCYEKRRKLHGMTNTKEFFAWRGILSRCNNPTDEAYKNYGGRGIKVCQRWGEFKSFFEDMGFAPTKEHSIDRIENNKGYYKENCRWATIKQQHRNKRTTRIIEHNGDKMCLKDWAAKLNINYYTLMSRLDRGLSVQDSFTKSAKAKK